MSHHDVFENRKQFQLERLILFSDAVFAIAITLLVIEIRVPQIEHSTNLTHDLAEALLEKWHEFFGFLLSFAVIGQFWTNHHRLFGQVTSYDNKLLWLNLLMLFFIVLVPFTSGLNSHYGQLNLVWIIYSFNLFLIAASLFLLYRYVGNPKHRLSDLAYDPLAKRFSRIRGISVGLVFLAGAVIAMFPGVFAFWAARYVFFLIPVFINLINRRYRKLQTKNNPAHENGATGGINQL